MTGERKRRKAEEFDSRCQWVANVTGVEGPGKAQFSPGDVMTFMVETISNADGHIVFQLPNVTALFLHFAKKMYEDSRSTDGIFTFKAPNGSMLAEDEAAVFDLLEMRMASIVFAYTALEAFANEYIPGDFVYKQTKKSGEVSAFTKDDIERYLSLNEKIMSLLPGILGVEPIKKGSSLWNRYSALRDFRDRIVHSKAKDRLKSGLNDKTLWSALFGKQFRNFSEDATELVAYFMSARVGTGPRWFAPEERARAKNKS
jgi:hypothetical protein